MVLDSAGKSLASERLREQPNEGVRRPSIRCQNFTALRPAQKAAASMEEISYCTREMVQDALGYADNVRTDRRIDSAIRASTREIEDFLHRTFLPRLATRSFDMPDTDILWLYDSELASTPTAFTSGGTAMTSGTDYLLRPESGPPYRWIEERTAGSIKFQAGATWQNSLSITGDFSHPCRELAAAQLSGSINASVTSLVLDDSSQVGTGSLLGIDDEYLLITERTMSTTGTTISSDLTASKSEVTIPVASGAAVALAETIQVGAERMRVLGVDGNNLIVERAARGTVLAAHTSGATVMAPRTCTVTRGMRGSTAAGHTDTEDVYVLRPPSLIEELCAALAGNIVTQASANWAVKQGAGENARTPDGRGIQVLMEQAYTAYGRKVRTRAVM